MYFLSTIFQSHIGNICLENNKNDLGLIQELTGSEQEGSGMEVEGSGTDVESSGSEQKGTYWRYYIN